MPLDAVRQTLRVERARRSRARPTATPSSTRARSSRSFRSRRCCSAAASDRRAHARTGRRSSSQPGRALAAVGVDRLLGTRTSSSGRFPRTRRGRRRGGRVARRRGQPAARPRSGRARRRCSARAWQRPRRRRRARLPVLVIDDSLTTRMLEQSILESAGYEVELAASAEEGLEKAQASALRPVPRRRRDAGNGRLRVRRADARRPRARVTSRRSS